MEHTNNVAAYASICNNCHTHTSLLMRVQARVASITPLIAPDGTEAEIVDDTPTSVTFYIPAGPHKGYYDYDKHTKAKTIRQA